MKNMCCFLMQRYGMFYSTYIPEPGKTFNLTTMATQQQILSRKEKRRIAIFTNSTLHHTQLLKKTILFLILFCCSSLHRHSQAATDATITIENGTGLFFVALPDSNCTQIEVAIGTKANLPEVLNYTFDLDK